MRDKAAQNTQQSKTFYADVAKIKKVFGTVKRDVVTINKSFAQQNVFPPSTPTDTYLGPAFFFF